MNTEKLLTELNVPAVVAVIGVTVNVFLFTPALKRLRGLAETASDEQLAHEVLAIQDDPFFTRIELEQRKFLFIPRELADVEALYAVSVRDELTKVYNRRGLAMAYSRLRASADSEGTLVILYFDANRFKVVNDRFGHVVGDQVLKAMCARLRRQLKKEDVVARIGGDEFVALVWLANDKVSERFMDNRLPRIQTVVCQGTYAIKNGSIILPTGFALGIHTHTGVLPETYTSLLRKAEIGMYADKGASRR